VKTKLDIAMVVPGLPFNGDTLKKGALGGSETAAIYMAKNLQRHGGNVIVFCNTPEAMTDDDGVRYIPISAWGMYSRGTPHDITIIQRMPELFAQPINSRLTVMWCHDLALGRQASMFRSALWNVDFIFVLSEFMREQYKTVYGIDNSILRVTRNGIDTSLFSANETKKRDRFNLIYSARPERGLDMVLGLMPRLIKRDERFHLTVCGYDNTVPQWAEFYARCDAMMKALGPRHAVRAGNLTKPQLYNLYETAGVYAYPTPSPALPNFAEISCISAMEAMAAGLPIVTTNKGALRETIANGAGSLIEGKPGTPEYDDAFVEACVRYATDDAAFNDAGVAGRACSRRLDWGDVASGWLQLFEQEIKARNSNADTAFRHLYRMSDIIVAQEWLRERPEDFSDTAALEKLLEPFAFINEQEGYRKQYERIGATHDDYVYDTAPREPRFGLLKTWLQENESEIKNVLDYGCAHGAYAIGLAKQLPHLSIHGVDIDHFSTDMATKWAKQLDVADRATFAVWTHDAGKLQNDIGGMPFECALLQEVLEHVPEPWAVAQNVERQVKKDGWVYITVPFGPWEYASYHNYPWRCHVWHFDHHDLHDMFGSKPDLTIDTYYAGDSNELGIAQGWWIVSYRADHKPVPRIDTERKRWLMRPRQTVSASLIAGGASVIETLLWNLRSIYHVADEIVIADCGVPIGHLDTAIKLLDDTEPVARWRDKIRIVPGVDPREKGFDVARNMSLAACRMDWVFWLDTDERLMQPTILQKYLRENYYHGYGMRQHHLSCDVPMNPDMPVRLFRRRAHRDGRALSFIGALHEHPELSLNDGPGPIIVLSDVHIAHLGYLTESIRQNRFVRNFPLLKLDEEKYPDRMLQKFFIMRDKVQIARFELQNTGGRVTPQVRAMMREVVELGRKHFVGKGNYLNSDAIAYYSEALTILGEGFHTTMMIEADKVQSKPNGSAAQYRFANKEDFLAEFTRRANERIDPLEQEYY